MRTTTCRQAGAEEGGLDQHRHRPCWLRQRVPPPGNDVLWIGVKPDSASYEVAIDAAFAGVFY